MKRSKAIFAILAIMVFFFLAERPAAQAGEGLQLWPLTPGAKGETFYGTLVIVYKQTGLGCFFADDQIVGIEDGVTMTFLMTLHKNRMNSWNFLLPDPDYTGPPPAPLIPYKDEGPSGTYDGETYKGFCLTLDIDTGLQQQALLKFLNDVVRPGLKGGNFSAIYLTQVENVYDTIRDLTVAGPPDYVVADVTIVAK